MHKGPALILSLVQAVRQTWHERGREGQGKEGRGKEGKKRREKERKGKYCNALYYHVFQCLCSEVKALLGRNAVLCMYCTVLFVASSHSVGIVSVCLYHTYGGPQQISARVPIGDISVLSPLLYRRVVDLGSWYHAEAAVIRPPYRVQCCKSVLLLYNTCAQRARGQTQTGHLTGSLIIT